MHERESRVSVFSERAYGRVVEGAAFEKRWAVAPPPRFESSCARLICEKDRRGRAVLPGRLVCARMVVESPRLSGRTGGYDNW